MVLKLIFASQLIAMCSLAFACKPPGECEPAASHCEGNDLVTCELPEDADWEWSHTECEKYCVESGGRGFCALEKEPTCEWSSGYRCDGNSATVCDAGYLVRKRECGDLEFCVDNENVQCALARSPDPRCEGDNAYDLSVCKKSQVAVCEDGFLVMSQACDANRGPCVSSGGKAGCALSSSPDPRCSDDRDLCEGNTLQRCLGGFLVSEFECLQRSRCMADGLTATCAY